MESSLREEEIDFLDALDAFSVAECESEARSICSQSSMMSFDEEELVANSLSYDLWAKEPIVSIDDRRQEFQRQTGLEFERWRSAREPDIDVAHENVPTRPPRGPQSVRLRGGEVDSSSSKASLKASSKASSKLSSMMSKYGKCVSNAGELRKEEGVVSCRRTVSDVELIKKSPKIGTSPSLNAERVQGIAKWVHQQFRKRESSSDVGNVDYLGNKERKDSWIKRLTSKGSSNKERRFDGRESPGSSLKTSSTGIHVNLRKKKLKELSGLYLSQDIDAHRGYILSIKFSPDGRRLVTTGQDGAVLVWEVTQDENSTKLDALGFESCLYVSSDGVTNVDLFNKREDSNVMRKLKKLPEKACIVAPRRFFRIVEMPLQCFHEHKGAVLDISWSNKELLLSASVDKTVRLWQLGQHHSIRVFAHHNFVTCVQFNPTDDDFFISGSIDGIVRVWSIALGKVVYWIDIKEIVTAICYRPDSKGAIAGTISGNCHVYDFKDDRFQLEGVVSLEGKKSSNKRISSFQFSPCGSNNVIVTSGDSQVRILNGLTIVCKLKGVKSGKKHMSGSFTADGKYVISAGADSNVYLWNCLGIGGTSRCHNGNEISSYENFISENALIAVPWHGNRDASSQSTQEFSDKEVDGLPSRLSAMVMPSVGEAHMKLLTDVCERIAQSDMWGLVLVTGGSDGRIRAYHNYGLPVHT